MGAIPDTGTMSGTAGRGSEADDLAVAMLNVGTVDTASLAVGSRILTARITPIRAKNELATTSPALFSLDIPILLSVCYPMRDWDSMLDFGGWDKDRIWAKRTVIFCPRRMCQTTSLDDRMPAAKTYRLGSLHSSSDIHFDIVP